MRSNKIKEFIIKLKDYKLKDNKIDENLSWLTCVLALKSVSLGNYGVGAVIADNDDNVTITGHNLLINPYFRSDLHAEMVVMTEFEDKFKNKSKKGFKLYTSLEPCPMCLSRLLTSGIEEVYYVADDELGGMANKINNMPKVWQEIAVNRIFKRADCSIELKKIAFDIFLINARKLDAKLITIQTYGL